MFDNYQIDEGKQSTFIGKIKRSITSICQNKSKRISNHTIRWVFFQFIKLLVQKSIQEQTENSEIAESLNSSNYNKG